MSSIWGRKRVPTGPSLRRTTLCHCRTSSAGQNRGDQWKSGSSAESVKAPHSHGRATIALHRNSCVEVDAGNSLTLHKQMAEAMTKTRRMMEMSHATDDVAQLTATSPNCAVWYSPSAAATQRQMRRCHAVRMADHLERHLQIKSCRTGHCNGAILRTLLHQAPLEGRAVLQQPLLHVRQLGVGPHIHRRQLRHHAAACGTKQATVLFTLIETCTLNLRMLSG